MVQSVYKSEDVVIFSLWIILISDFSPVSLSNGLLLFIFRNSISKLNLLYNSRPVKSITCI